MSSQNSLKLRESSLLNSRKVCLCRHTHTHTVTHNITTHYTERVTGDRVKTKYGMITEAQATPVVYMVLCLLPLLVCVWYFCSASVPLLSLPGDSLTSPHTPTILLTQPHTDTVMRRNTDTRGWMSGGWQCEGDTAELCVSVFHLMWGPNWEIPLTPWSHKLITKF